MSVRALTRLTGLTSEEVDEAFQRLGLQGSIEFVQPQGRTCYRPIDLSDVPLVIDFDEWLDVYCSRPPEVEEGDTEAMTFGSCGFVILTGVLTGAGTRTTPALVVFSSCRPARALDGCSRNLPGRGRPGVADKSGVSPIPISP